MIDAERTKYLQNQIACYDDQWAYRELFTAYYSSLYYLAFSYVKSKQSAEEIVSDVFIKIWEKRRGLEKIDNFRVYVYVATRNTSLNYLEQQKRTATDSIEEFGNIVRSLYFDPEQLLITAEMISSIKKAIEGLPPKCRLIFKLVKEDRLPYRDVAEILHVSIKTVENQVAIALRKIGSAIHFDIKRTIPLSFKNS
ncbi:MAG TPA: RNA polymerase sigma-70 factor [Puia sp.]|nr:RNA polymerase sigma-70 factor [Puia sp.]